MCACSLFWGDLTRPKTPKGSFSEREVGPLTSGKSRLVKYYFIGPESIIIDNHLIIFFIFFSYYHLPYILPIYTNKMIPSTGKNHQKEPKLKRSSSRSSSNSESKMPPRLGANLLVNLGSSYRMYGIEAAASCSSAGFHNQFWISSQFSQMFISAKSKIDTLKWCFFCFRCTGSPFKYGCFLGIHVTFGGCNWFLSFTFLKFCAGIELFRDEIKPIAALCHEMLFFWKCPFLVLLPHLSFTLT